MFILARPEARYPITEAGAVDFRAPQANILHFPALPIQNRASAFPGTNQAKRRSHARAPSPADPPDKRRPVAPGGPLGALLQLLINGCLNFSSRRRF